MVNEETGKFYELRISDNENDTFTRREACRAAASEEIKCASPARLALADAGECAVLQLSKLFLHHKADYDFHGIYEPFVLIFRQAALRQDDGNATCQMCRASSHASVAFWMSAGISMRFQKNISSFFDLHISGINKEKPLALQTSLASTVERLCQGCAAVGDPNGLKIKDSSSILNVKVETGEYLQVHIPGNGKRSITHRKFLQIAGHAPGPGHAASENI